MSRAAAFFVGALVAGAATAAASDESPAEFRAVDVILDPRGAALAAYQLEITLRGQPGDIVGLEGGAAGAFADAPYYDPAALQAGRIIIAAFSLAADLPRAPVRVATLHLRMGRQTTVEPRLIVAANADGATISALLSLRPHPAEAPTPQPGSTP